ncbi:MAG: hypothetical protein QXX04_00595 [Candidatus Aenigmatarchaeota archaeon]
MINIYENNYYIIMTTKLKSLVEKLFERFQTRGKNTQEHKIIEIHYPINIDGYRNYWGLWEMLREFISNAIDAENGNWENIHLEVLPGKIVIHNKSRLIDIRDFYFGYSSQGKGFNNNEYIGRFNEGMKLAIAIALRIGYELEIFSGSYRIKPEIENKNGLRTFKIYVYKNENEIEGTRVEIKGKNIDEVEVKNLLKNNIIWPKDNRIVYEVLKDKSDGIFNYDMQIIKSYGKVFIGGMFVSKIENLAWGYNFNPSLVRLSEGRNLLNEEDVRKALKKYIPKINNLEYWVKIFEDIRDKKLIYESTITINGYLMKDSTKQTIRRAWLHVFGEDTVVKYPIYPETLCAGAAYRGAKIIVGNQLLISLALVDAVPSCREFLERYQNTKRLKIEYNELADWEKKIYDVIDRNFIKRYLKDWKLVIYEPTDTLNQNEYGYASHSDREIGIRRALLRSCNKYYECRPLIDTILEELTHAIYGTDDMSRYHVNMLRYFASILLTIDRKFVCEVVDKLIEIGEEAKFTYNQ